MVTKEEMAEMLSGNEYGSEMTEAQRAIAKESGLIIVYGYRDDGMEFDGAIRDEVGSYGGGVAYLKDGDLLFNRCGNYECPHYAKEVKAADKIAAVWDKEGYSWVYETAIPHAVFDIMEGEEKYCRGIVF